MRHVYLAALKSKDPRTKIGAILTRDKNIISTGFNGFPIGVNDNIERYENKETKYKFVCHAEANSILTAARFGISTLNSILYTQGVPCCECAKTIIQGGVKEVVVHRPWPDMNHSIWLESVKISNIMFKESEVKIRWFYDILGVEGYLDGKTIKV